MKITCVTWIFFVLSFEIKCEIYYMVLFIINGENRYDAILIILAHTVDTKRKNTIFHYVIIVRKLISSIVFFHYPRHKF